MKRPLIITIIIVVVLIIAGIVALIMLSSGGDLSDCPYPEEICNKWYPDAVPNCQEDSFNCGDFDTQAGAQWVYDYCVDWGSSDIHRLDSDGDSVVCESLS